MSLPIRYQSSAGPDRILSVDGVLDAPGLNLSHWPGNQTPTALKHELSTGIALNFVALPDHVQAKYREGLQALVNNHFDTDGLLSLFVLSNPNTALAHSERLLNWARAGDFFQVRNLEAFCFDHLVMQYVDTNRSPLASKIHGLQELDRYQHVTEWFLERLPQWLESGLTDQEPLYREAVARYETDLEQVAQSQAIPLVHFELMVNTLTVPDAGPGSEPRTGSEVSLPGSKLPGRHSLFTAAECDRVLMLAPSPSGTRARLLVSTLSWFEIPGRKGLPRPDLADLARTLNGLEGTTSAAESTDTCAWRYQDPLTPSPELWFGLPQNALFMSHVEDQLGFSKLDPLLIKTKVVDALRAAWVFENVDDTSDMDDIFAV